MRKTQRWGCAVAVTQKGDMQVLVAYKQKEICRHCGAEKYVVNLECKCSATRRNVHALWCSKRQYEISSRLVQTGGMLQTDTERACTVIANTERRTQALVACKQKEMHKEENAMKV